MSSGGTGLKILCYLFSNSHGATPDLLWGKSLKSLFSKSPMLTQNRGLDVLCAAIKPTLVSKSISPAARCQSWECLQAVCQVVCPQWHTRGVLLLIFPMWAMLLLFPTSHMLRRLTSLWIRHALFFRMSRPLRRLLLLWILCTETENADKLAPGEWEDESKYDLENIKIWHAWLSFKTKSEIKSWPLVRSAELFHIPPCLPWYIRSEKHVSRVMHFMTVDEGQGYKKQKNANGEYLHHTSNALRSDVTLQSTCWEKQRKGCTDDVYFHRASAKQSHLHSHMAQSIVNLFFYADFLKEVIDSSNRTLLCSQVFHALVKMMFRGKPILMLILNVTLTNYSPWAMKTSNFHVTPSIWATGNSINRTKLSMLKNQISNSTISENTSTFILCALMVWIWLAWGEELLPMNFY